jgi:hypothetical protein
MTHTEATTKIASYTAQLMKRQPEMDKEFAEGLATYMVLKGIKKPSQARMAVWSMGKAGLEKMRKQVSEMD